MEPTLIDTVRTWLSDPLFTPLINFATVLILGFTAIEGLRSARASSESNELALLPLLVVKFVGQPIQNRGIAVKNVGHGTAYDVEIEKYVYVVTDARLIWELIMTIKGVNLLESGEERNLSIRALQNGRESGVGDFLVFHLDPEEEHERESVDLFITFKNAKGVKYYSRIRTGQRGLTLIIPPTRLDLWGVMTLKYSELKSNILVEFFKVFWQLSPKTREQKT